MKCSSARHWLFAAEVPDHFPEPVQRHLDRCPRCRRCCAVLHALETVAVAEPIPALVEARRARLHTALAQVPAPVAVPSPRTRWRVRWPGLAAAVLVAFGIGWLVGGSRQAVEQSVPVRLPDAGGLPSSDDLLVARLLERNLRLARAGTPGDQLQVLSDMADDLRLEAVHLARSGPTRDVPLVTSLYERVVRRGVVGRAVALAPPQRPLVTGVLDQLRDTETEIARTAGELPPTEADLLLPVGRAARAASQSIRAGEKPMAGDDMGPLADDLGPQRALLTVLVLQGLRLAEEEDPSARADYLRELAELEGLLRQASRVLHGLEQGRAARGASGLPSTLTGDEKERVKELERTLKELDKALKKMKSEKPSERDKGKGKEHKDDKRERDDEDEDRHEKGKGKSGPRDR